MVTPMPLGPGSGAGGTNTPGAPMSPTQTEIETSAWANVNRAALGITHDSIELAFSQITHRYSNSHLSSETGYRARESQPRLAGPMEHVRVQQSFNPLPDESWTASYEELVQKLPPGILERFLEELKKPKEEQHPAFIAINNILIFGARILTNIALSSQLPAEGSLESARMQINAALPFWVMKQSISATGDAAEMAALILREMGANLPNFDDYQDILTQVAELTKGLKSLDLQKLAEQQHEGPA